MPKQVQDLPAATSMSSGDLHLVSQGGTLKKYGHDLHDAHIVSEIVDPAIAAITPASIGASAAGHDHAGVYEPAGVAWTEVSGKPATFPPDAHAAAHATGQPDAVSPASIGAAAAGHNHDVTYVNEADHTKAAHDALLIDAATLDGVDSTGFAVAAKGVTNGDAHDHSGGDGAQIAYSSLSGLPTIPAVASAGEVADSTTGVEADGTSPRFARADHVHHYEAGVPGSHAATHQNGGADEISVAGLSGLLADAQTPIAHASAHQPGGGDAMAVDAVAGTGSLRTLGSGAQQAAAGNHSHGAGGGIVAIEILSTAAVGGTPWTNMPAALSFWLGTASSARNIRRVDLTGKTQVRLRVLKLGVAGGASSKIILRYKADPMTMVVANYSDIGVSEVSTVANVQNAWQDTGWINLAAGAIGDVYVALLGSGGDGVLDPVWGNVVAEFQ